MYLKSTCDVNLLSKLSIIIKEWRVIVLCTFKVPQGANNLILWTLDTIHIFFFVTRLIINKVNKEQWVDFKLENVLVSLHSSKTMGLFGASAPLFFRNGELLGHSPMLTFVKFLSCMDNATSYQTACCGVIDNVAILH